ncbi:hypothetical protein LMG19087_03498 [Ralstonia wenshanensis]|uniref:hypothetical protein n=1 Tax=Ralstonia wenshanensis TaxID=2842456 RepID=UPI0028F4E00D|nr:hypothetical protein [Ralstonia wenshanensis]CAJ0818651.1 hypothetical protein LMG19087_03498 [Ralstonia wenshanensis]
MRVVLAPLLAATLLCGCTVYSKVKLYDGPNQDQKNVSLLYVDPHVVVRRFDTITEQSTDGSALVHSAGKRREIIEMLPGQHELDAQFFLLCRRSELATLKFNAEAGQSYRLTYDLGEKSAWWRPFVAAYHGENIEEKASMFDSMCNVQIIRVPLR